MRPFASRFAALALTIAGCATSAVSEQAVRPSSTTATQAAAPHSYVGFDSNDYPGDEALPALRRHFAFAGYWLNNPPSSNQNSWKGKRDALLRANFGFLVLVNGRLEAEIGKSKKSGILPAAFGEKDASDAVAAARREHFPAHTILFLDQEEGGRLTADQSAYLLAWTEAVAHSGYLPGIYASGQAVGDGPGKTITTVQDVRQQIAAKHLHQIAVWVYQDACPPANGCSLQPPPLAASGTPDVAIWQYAQSPQRKSITAACGKTYAADGNCYAPDVPQLPLDLSVSSSPDPSHGR
jgi:hypothetical protein